MAEPPSSPEAAPEPTAIPAPESGAAGAPAAAEAPGPEAAPVAPPQPAQIRVEVQGSSGTGAVSVSAPMPAAAQPAAAPAPSAAVAAPPAASPATPAVASSPAPRPPQAPTPPPAAAEPVAATAPEPLAPEPVAPEPAAAEPAGVAATIAVPPLEDESSSGGGEWEMLLHRLETWLGSGELNRQWQKIRGPLKVVAILLVAVLALRVYSSAVATVEAIPLISGLLELVGLISVIHFSLTRLVRASDRQQVLRDWQQRWLDFRGRN